MRREGIVRGVLLGCALAAARVAGAAEPWDAPPFSATAAELMRAAQAVPSDPADAVVVLLEECEVRFEDDGRSTRRFRQVFRIDSDRAREAWSSVTVSWAPWHQGRPELRARVVAADGREHPLDPATVIDSGLGREGQVYSDRRQLEAPLPAWAVGSIVELQTVVRDDNPMFPAGSTQRFYVGGSEPILRSRLVLDAPEALSLRWQARSLPGPEPRREERDGRVRLVFERTHLEPLQTPEAGLPPDVPRWPHVAFSTGSSWAEVARAYSKVVDRQLAGADLRHLMPPRPSRTKDRHALARTLLARIDQEVRYTALEFGEASLVPRTPGEVLARRYGDCKDKATLLIGLLRAAGVPASVALLSSGYGEDVPTELPGLGSFNHAIVHVPGEPELWIDATAGSAVVGALPTNDQGRMALVAAETTTGLVETPAVGAAANGSIETREVYLSEFGLGRVVETTEYRGSFDRYFREQYTDAETESKRSQLEDYVAKEYSASRLGLFEQADPANVERPFWLKLEALEAGAVPTSENEAVMSVALTGLTDGLPELILAAAGEQEPPRQGPYFFAVPYFAEQRYRIVPPAGFALVESPAGEELDLGPAHLTVHWKVQPDGALSGAMRFESGKRHIAAEEFRTMKAAVLALRGRAAVRIRFAQLGQAQLAAGRVQEALAEFRRLTVLHPKESWHHTQLALALLKVGLGEAAREAARRAVALEPRNVIAQRRLGWVLQHDLVGRRFRHGFDSAGAEQAHRQAVALAPADTHTRLNLAFLLEHNADGQRWGRGAKLSEAADEYWRLSREHGEQVINLVHVLLRSDRQAELKEAATRFSDPALRESFEVLAAVVLDDPSAAVRRAAQIADVQRRREVLAENADWLLQVRQYAAAVALLQEALRGAENAAALRARLEFLSKLKHHEELPEEDPSPAGVVRAFVRGVVLEGEESALLELFTRRARDQPALSTATDVIKSARRGVTRFCRQLGRSSAVCADVVLSTLETSVEGDDRVGYQVRLRGSWAEAGPPEVMWVVREEAGYRILGGTPFLSELGGEAIQRVEAGDLDGARRLLDWARARVGDGGSDRSAAHPLALAWRAGHASTAEQVLVAAASLSVAGHAQAARAVAVLEERLPLAQTDEERDALDLALLWGYDGRPVDVLVVAERLARRLGTSEVLFINARLALTALERWGELKEASELRLRLHPGDLEGDRALRVALTGLADFAGVDRLCAVLLDSGRGEALDNNECAWNALVSGGPRDIALARARRAVELSGRKSWGYLHTLAALYAESGHAAEARDVILEAMTVGEREEPRSEDWYVFGLLAESYGERQSAAAAYHRVTGAGGPATSSWALAQTRLRSLEASAKPIRKKRQDPSASRH